MKQLFTFLFFIGATVVLLAQEKTPNPCGTAPVKSDWLKRYQANPAAFANFTRNPDSLLFVGTSLHLVGNDNGVGYIQFDRLMEGFCDLNTDFDDVNIRFFIEGDIHFIDSTGWYSHATVLEGADMMFANNVANTMNVYVVSNPAGNAGYNLPYAGIALNQAAASGGRHTWSHEVGHNLSIQHPFLGWEGKTYSYNTPTPTTVTYNYTYFKDTLIVDTLIIDTAQVELVNGTNCTVAADGFCDTPPDYLSMGGWQCNAQGLSATLQKDPNGVDFRSDATNIMSYSNDACVTQFTPEQMAAMRAYLQTVRSYYLYNQNPKRDTITQPVVHFSPVAGTVEQYDYVPLVWQSVEHATHYVVQVSRLSSFAFIEYSALVADTSVIVTNLANNKTYYWRVKPFNQTYTCAPISANESFMTQDITKTEMVQSIEGFQLYPSILDNGQQLNIRLNSRKPLNASVALYNMAGQRLQNELWQLNVGENAKSLNLQAASAGAYFVQILTEEGVITEKIVVY
jgi:hypothetical protein